MLPRVPCRPPAAGRLRGAALAQELAAVEPEQLDDHDLLEHLADWERVASWVAAQQLAVAADFARRPSRFVVASEDTDARRANFATLGHRVREHADDEVAARLRISRHAAEARISAGCALVGLPATAEALAEGQIDFTRARVLIEETAELDARTRREVELELVAIARECSAPRLRPRARRAVLAADPLAAHQRAVRAKAGRRVWVTPAADGMADLWAHLPAREATAIHSVLRAAARASRADASPDDDRSMDQRMADVLAVPFLDALATGRLAPVGAVDGAPRRASIGHGPAAGRSVDGADLPNATGVPDGTDPPTVGESNDADLPSTTDLPSAAGVRLAKHRGQVAELHVTVAASTLLGLDDAPAQLAGYGPITAEVARELAPDSRMRRILTDPRTGVVLDVGTTLYRPPVDLARFIEVRAQTCVFPGCGWPAARCDQDHTIPFPRGTTCPCNLSPRCRRHHRFKHRDGVRVEKDPDGSDRWRLPTGHTYLVAPPCVGLPVEHREDSADDGLGTGVTDIDRATLTFPAALVLAMGDALDREPTSGDLPP